MNQDQRFLDSLRENKGQTFIEFIFLLLILITLSFALIKGVNTKVAERWKFAVSRILQDKPTTVPELN